MLINAFVVTRIDYCNIVLTGASVSNIQRIQWTQQLDCCSDLRNSPIFRQSWLVSCIGFLPIEECNSSCYSWWQFALLAGLHPIFVSSASWCRQFRNVCIFVLQTSFSSLDQDVTVLQHSRVVHGSLFLDPTRPGETSTRPDPRLPTESLTRPDPRPDPSPIWIVFNWIIIY